MGVKFLVTSLALLIGLGAVYLFGLATPDSMNFPRPFNSERWKAADLDGNLRCSMVTDLRYRVGLTGRTREEVVSLLGRPDGEANRLPAFYDLCPSFMDVYVLELTWENGRVASAIVHDT
jgi:hypothetical protein